MHLCRKNGAIFPECSSSTKRRRPAFTYFLAEAFLLFFTSNQFGLIGASIRKISKQPHVVQVKNLRRSQQKVFRMKNNDAVVIMNQTRKSNTIQDNNNTPHNKEGTTTLTSIVIDAADKRGNKEIANNRIQNTSKPNDKNGNNTSIDNENSTGEEVKRIIKMVIGLIIVVFGGLSLLGWIYAFYLRYKYNKECELQEMEEKADQTGSITITSSNDSSLCQNPPLKQFNRIASPKTMKINESESVLEHIPRSYAKDFHNCADDDSFGKELETAKQIDRNLWSEAEGQRVSWEAKSKHVRPLAPPIRDVSAISSNFDGISELYKRKNSLQQELQIKNKKSSDTAPDPDDLVLTSGSSTSSSYIGKNSSVEEDEGSGFEVINYHDTSDEMNAHLLNPVPVGDDESFGQQSGMEMSLGTDNDTNGSLSPKGFFAIDNENDMRYDYISPEEYEAAVEAAALVLNKGLDDLSPMPSDEQMGLSLNPSDEIMQDYTDIFPSSQTEKKLNETRDTDPVLSSSSMTSSSNSQPISIDDGKSNNSGESILNVFKELKNVSIFLKRFERKKSRKLQKAREEKAIQKSIHSSEWTRDEESGSTDNLNISTDASKLTSTLPLPSNQFDVNNKDNKKQKPRFRRPSFVRKMSGSAEVTDLRHGHEYKKGSIKTSRAKTPHLPPLPNNNLTKNSIITNSIINRIKNQEQPFATTDTQQMSVLESKSTKNLQSKIQPFSPEVRSVVSNPSPDSSMSEATFLEAEIESFFSQKEPSLSNLLSENGSSFQQNKINQQSVTKDITFNASFDTVQTNSSVTSDRGKFNRLGIVPFDPKEVDEEARPNKKQKLPVTNIHYIESINQGEVNLRDPKNSRSRYKDVIPPSNVRASPRSRIRQRDELFKQRGNQIGAMDKPQIINDNPEISMTQTAVTSLQNGTRKIASFFESREGGQSHLDTEYIDKETDYVLNNKSQLKLVSKSLGRDNSRILTGGGAAGERIRNSKSESKKSSMKSSAQNLISIFESRVPAIPKGNQIWTNRRSTTNVTVAQEKKLQQTEQTRNEPSPSNEIISPSFVGSVRRTSRLSNPQLRGKITNDYIQDSEQAYEASNLTQKISSKARSHRSAKNLISIFESNKKGRDSPSITPQSEHWQYS